ncbi:MAG TPA: F0F1 ATP synthase subunit epsilon [Roseiflexaceae bacterium]|nr:F0F1 ATP synthase subunit epsilon [Roseiflexaceae bacterium]
MNTFTLHLHSMTAAQTVAGVRSLVARDGSGSFGIQAGHEDFMTALEFGLARYRCGDEWRYLALPGGILRVADGVVWLFTRRYLEDSDYRRLGAELERQLRAEEAALRETRLSLRQMEQHLLRRLWELEQRGGTA